MLSQQAAQNPAPHRPWRLSKAAGRLTLPGCPPGLASSFPAVSTGKNNGQHAITLHKCLTVIKTCILILYCGGINYLI